MKISVIMPVYNEGSEIRQTLAALAGAGDWHEVLLIDASSKAHPQQDYSVPAAWPASALPLQVQRAQRRGRAAQMNQGASTAGGDVLLFLHADTLLPAEAANVIRQGLSAPHEVWGRFDVVLDHDSGVLWLVSRMMNWRTRQTGIVTGDHGIFMRRHAFEQIQGFPDQALMEDIEISKRLKKLRAPVNLDAKVITSARRWLSRGTIRTIALMWSLRLAYWAGVPAQRIAHWYQGSRG